MDSDNTIKTNSGCRKKVIPWHFQKRCMNSISQNTFNQTLTVEVYRGKIKSLLKNNRFLATALQNSRRDVAEKDNIAVEAGKHLDMLNISKLKFLEVSDGLKAIMSCVDGTLTMLNRHVSIPNEKKENMGFHQEHLKIQMEKSRMEPIMEETVIRSSTAKSGKGKTRPRRSSISSATSRKKQFKTAAIESPLEMTSTIGRKTRKQKNLKRSYINRESSSGSSTCGMSESDKNTSDESTTNSVTAFGDSAKKNHCIRSDTCSSSAPLLHKSSKMTKNNNVESITVNSDERNSVLSNSLNCQTYSISACGTSESPKITKVKRIKKSVAGKKSAVLKKGAKKSNVDMGTSISSEYVLPESPEAPRSADENTLANSVRNLMDEVRNTFGNIEQTTTEPARNKNFKPVESLHDASAVAPNTHKSNSADLKGFVLEKDTSDDVSLAHPYISSSLKTLNEIEKKKIPLANEISRDDAAINKQFILDISDLSTGCLFSSQNKSSISKNTATVEYNGTLLKENSNAMCDSIESSDGVPMAAGVLNTLHSKLKKNVRFFTESDNVIEVLSSKTITSKKALREQNIKQDEVPNQSSDNPMSRISANSFVVTAEIHSPPGTSGTTKVKKKTINSMQPSVVLTDIFKSFKSLNNNFMHVEGSIEDTMHPFSKPGQINVGGVLNGADGPFADDDEENEIASSLEKQKRKRRRTVVNSYKEPKLNHKMRRLL